MWVVFLSSCTCLLLRPHPSCLARDLGKGKADSEPACSIFLSVWAEGDSSSGLMLATPGQLVQHRPRTARKYDWVGRRAVCWHRFSKKSLLQGPEIIYLLYRRCILLPRQLVQSMHNFFWHWVWMLALSLSVLVTLGKLLHSPGFESPPVFSSWTFPCFCLW